MRGKANFLIWMLCVLFLLLTVCAVIEGKVIYVDDDATGANDGSSWENAYNYLQDALADANSTAKPVELRVAQGIYTPDIGIGITPGDRNVSFQLINDVTIKGGYAGIGLSDPNALDIELYETILSGDLAGDDIDVTNPEELRDEPTRAENSYHVVTGDGTDETAVLDGFTITAGNANGSGANSGGGGMYNSAGSPIVTNCTFKRNSARSDGGGMSCEDNSNPTLTNCMFMMNSAFYGGGMYNYNSNPTLTNCTFTDNITAISPGVIIEFASRSGGGMYNSRSSPTMTNCTFSGNSADRGSGMYNYESSPILTNCTFRRNSGFRGGGMYNSESNPTLTNCLFIGNSADYYAGGGMVNYNSSPILNNCTFIGNWAEEGGAMTGGSPTLVNCIVWGNTSPQILSDASISFSNIQDGWPGEGNINADPLFVDADGDDDVFGTEDDNLQLLAGSACIDAGDNSAVPPFVVTDVYGNPRIINCIVDMGAYESPPPVLLISTNTLVVPEGNTATFTVALAEPPSERVGVTVSYHSGDWDIAVESEGLLTFDASNYSVPQTVTLEAAEDSDNLNSTTQILITTTNGFIGVVTATEADNEPNVGILFVDDDAGRNNNGSNWADAYTDLQEALSAAAASHGVEEIRVAQGIYRPDQGGGNIPGDKEATFQLINGIIIKGGFAGVNEADSNIRDIEIYQTILSGDLADNDFDVNDPIVLPYEPTRADNSFNVVTASGTNNTALLDGFMVVCGNSIDSSAQSGGGIYNIAGSPIITECAFIWNWAWDGGGMCNSNSSPTLINCTFLTNSGFYGGGMYNFNSNPTLINCTFTQNSTITPSGVIVERAIDSGGGLYNGTSSLTITNCTFRENSSCKGGGIYGGSLILTNCIFSSNSAVDGGGIAGSDPILTNCTLTGNQAKYGGGVISSGNPKLFNCIVWGNTSPQISCYPYTKISYSDIQGGWEGKGEGNIDTDPLFAEAGYWADVNDMNIIVEPNDPNAVWIEGDYHLKSQAGRWDPVSQSWVIDDVTSPCIDAGDPNSPVAFEPFPNGGVINMGAYGGKAEASKSYVEESLMR